MATCTPPANITIVGTFTTGQQNVGEISYSDAVCGTPTCGFAITGKWWAYLCPPELDLNAISPAQVFAGEVVTVTPAELDLRAVVPTVTIIESVTLVAPSAALTLSATAPGFLLSQRLPAPSGELDLMAGPSTIRFVGQVWLWLADCIEDDLVPADCSDLDLQPAAATTVVLEPAGCR